MNQSPGIQAEGLRKRYGRTEALAGVGFHVPEGGVALMVGPNGAGKTTLLKVLMDLLPYEEGSVEVLGLDPARDGARIRAAAGFLPENLNFPFDRLKVRDVLALHARFRPRWDATYAQNLARALELRMDQPWKKLSKGESRRVQLACALIPRPPLLLLDEPTDGLDPLGRERVLGLLAEHLAETGATTIYCTHVLHEAQGLADRLMVLSRGTIQLEEDADVLRRTHFRVRFSTRDGAPTPPPGVLRIESNTAGEWRAVVRGNEDELRSWASHAGVDLTEFATISLGDTALAYLSHGADAPPSPFTSGSQQEASHV